MKLSSSLAALAATTLAANAATTIIDTLDPAGVAYGSVSGDSATADIGHTFTTGILGSDTSLSTIVIATPDNNDNGTTEYRLQVFENDDVATTWDPGTILGLSDAQTFRNSDGATATFTFSGVTLADSTVYGYRWMTVTGPGTTAATTSIRLTGVNTNTAASITEAGGELFANSATSFSRAAPMEITTVPEPSSAALLGLGGLALILRRRKD